MKKSPKKSAKLKGVAASPGITIGKVFKLSGDDIKVEERSLNRDQVLQEVKKFERAIELTRKELIQIQNHAKIQIGKEAEQIFFAHQMLLDDQFIIDETLDQIKKQKKNADFVYHEVVAKYQASLETVDNEYFSGRVADIRDVKRRLIRNIQGGKCVALNSLTQKAVIVAHDLSPSDTVLLDKQKVMGFATDKGGKTSHAAILARSLGIPSVVGLQEITSVANNDDTIIVDGTNGDVYINPSSSVLDKYFSRRDKYAELTRELSKIRELPCRTLDGKDVELSANLDFPTEIDSVINYGARGVGLFRTEYIYLTSDELPTEEQEYQEYINIANKLFPQPLIIRTLDIGGDKNPKYLPLPDEDNPALGYRAIRMCLDNIKLFKSQLSAILRASAMGNVKILLPMISCLEEIQRTKAIIDQVKGELQNKKLKFDNNIEIGVMIEIPSAAVMADVIAEEVDFLSIGTNDLIQYVVAADRTNVHVAHLFKRLPPAVLRIIKNVVEAGHKKGVWVGMCGEMAADPLATLILLGLGIDELSVNPAALPEIKKIVRSVTYPEAQKIAEKALQLKTSEQVEIYMRNVFSTRFKMKHI